MKSGDDIERTHIPDGEQYFPNSICEYRDFATTEEQDLYALLREQEKLLQSELPINPNEHAEILFERILANLKTEIDRERLGAAFRLGALAAVQRLVIWMAHKPDGVHVKRHWRARKAINQRAKEAQQSLFQGGQ